MRWIIMGFLGSFACSCASHREIPPPRIGEITINSTHDRDIVDSRSVAQYVQKYGKAGWIRGLTDDDLIVKPQLADMAPSRRDEAPCDWRVKDIFYLYYLHVFPCYNPGKRVSTATCAERDALIVKLVSEIRENSEP